MTYFTLIKKYTREDSSTPFFIEYEPYPKEYLMEINDRYIKPKKILKSTTEFSVDGKTQTTTTVWNDPDDLLNFGMDNPHDSFIAIYIKKQYIYNLKNNIKTETIFVGE